MSSLRIRNSFDLVWGLKYHCVFNEDRGLQQFGSKDQSMRSVDKLNELAHTKQNQSIVGLVKFIDNYRVRVNIIEQKRKQSIRWKEC